MENGESKGGREGGRDSTHPFLVPRGNMHAHLVVREDRDLLDELEVRRCAGRGLYDVSVSSDEFVGMSVEVNR